MSERWPTPVKDGISSRILDFVEYSRIYLALGDTLWAFAVALLLDIRFGITLGVIIFCSVFAAYALNRKPDLTEDDQNISIATENTARTMYSVGVVSLVLAIGLSLVIEPLLLLSIGWALLCLILYSIRIAPDSWRYQRLKEVPFVKNLTVAAGIAGSLVSAVVFYAGTSFTAGVIVLSGFVFSRVVIGAIIPDVRDIRGDRRAGVRTIPVLIGVRRTKWLLLGLNVIVTVWFYWAVVEGILPSAAYLAGLVNIVAFLLIFLLTRDNAQLLSLLSDVNDTYAFFLLTLLGTYGETVLKVYDAATAVALAVFLLCLLHAWRNRRLTFYGTALVYGLILERLAITAFETYSYPTEQFALSVFGIPIAIGLAWAAIVYSAYVTAMGYRFKKHLIPIVAGLYVLHIDFAIDAIAIRVRFWEWTPPGAWFGVPLGNFMAWYLVALLFTGTYLHFEERLANQGLLALSTLTLSSILLVLLLLPWDVFVAGHLYREVGVLSIVLIISFVVLIRSNRPNPTERKLLEPFLAVLLIHLFYLGVLLYYRFYQESFVLLIVSVAMLLVGVAIHLPLTIHHE